MGRYYYGDIEGKFWFGIQSSDAPQRFGADPQEPSTINYYLNSDDLETVQQELADIADSIDLDKLERFFKSTNGYNDDMLAAANITKHELKEYADYLLGKQMEECILEKGECMFDADF